MQTLLPVQRDHFYLQAATRSGIHKPLLAALYQVQGQPTLADGETGLGISPANQVSLEPVNSFLGQVHFAANTVRSLTNSLIGQGWKDADLWQSEQGRYSDSFLRQVANGFVPNETDPLAARLELCNGEELRRVYGQQATADWQELGKPRSQSFLDEALRSQARQLANQYFGLASQQAALLEVVRLWQGLETREAAIAHLSKELALTLDSALLFSLRQSLSSYAAYPHQRAALLQLVQLWYQFDSREATIRHLQQGTFPVDALLHTALLTFVQRIPRLFQGNGQHRNALVEGFRHWHRIDQRPTALVALGVNPDLFSGSAQTPEEINAATNQVDRALIEFIRQLPTLYTGSSHERESLLHLGQLWHNTLTQAQTVQALIEDLKRSESARRDSVDGLLKPTAALLPDPPRFWTPETLQLHAPILPFGSFTWAEATGGGLYLPTNQATIAAITTMADLAQQVRDRIGRPLAIVRWYDPGNSDALTAQLPHHRHAIGDAITFYCDGLTGNQLYWFLHPWWTGGLGRYNRHPLLCYIDGRSDRVRWFQD